MEHIITVKPTNNDTIVKFESNQFLVDHQTFEFANVDEAKPSKLAQELFYLPFVKKVYIAQNFVAVMRYDIVQWEDVQDEVASKVQTYLNSGQPIITQESVATTKTLPISVYVESTPNPRVRKFVTNKKLVLQPTEFLQASDAQEDSVPRSLFQFPLVDSVFVDDNYISISIQNGDHWEEISMELREFVREQLQQGHKIGDSTAQVPLQLDSVDEHNESPFIDLSKLDGISQQIVAILDEYIRPAVQGDGGNIQFAGYKEDSGEVRVVLQGACSGCPSSTATLKNGIETMLKDMLPGKIQEVVAING